MPGIEESFRSVLKNFTKRLTKQEVQDFQVTSLHDLHATINKIQNEQASRKACMNMTRLKSFLEAAEQFGNIVEVFLNTTDFLAFIWGPMKFLLTTASTLTESFETLLDAYVAIGERMPLLLQYRSLFEGNDHMTKALEMIYADILEFHRRALRVFRSSMTKQFFRSMWKDFNTRFQQILEDLRRHQQLIESMAGAAHFQQYHIDRESTDNHFKRLQKTELKNKYIDVCRWIVAADSSVDQNFAQATRRDYPQSGRWLLSDTDYSNWKSADIPRMSMTWMNGIPGAGKTVLTSFIIEDCQSSQSAAVGYFYCKHSDQQRRTCIAVLKSLLAQLMLHDFVHVPYYHDRYLLNGQLHLVSEALCKELLEAVVLNVPRVHIVIDGLDECDRSERTLLIDELNRMVRLCDSEKPGRLRVLVTSRNEPDIRKRMLLTKEIEITATRIQPDINLFVEGQCHHLQQKFDLTDTEVEYISKRTCLLADGMFLFADLVMKNLHGQTTLMELRAEVLPDRFPAGLDQAYRRIIDRISNNPNLRERSIAEKVLGWMVCAKRPLKWHEIQAALSIDTEEQSMEILERKSRVHIRDICGSLINELDGDRLELVHATATGYLIETRYVKSSLVERDLASLTIQYLTFECFEYKLSQTQRSNLIRQGYAAFQDYAVVHWSDHLQNVLHCNPALLQEQEDEGLALALKQFAHCLSEQDPHALRDPSPAEVAPDRAKFIERFQHYSFYPALCLISSQLAQHSAGGPDAFDKIWSRGYNDVVTANRQVLEECACHGVLDTSETKRLQSFYGNLWFKCPKATCFFFHEGFKDAKGRDQHVARHERPFRCTFATCSGFKMGFVAAKDLDRHTRTYHPEKDQLAVSFTRIRKAKGRIVKPEEPSSRASNHPLSFQCHLCPRKYSRAYNLRSHLRTHTDERPFICTVCSKAFARQHDRKRHEALHSGEKNFVCKGELESEPGTMWGCGRRFARADGLGLHFRSEGGRICIKPLLDEERTERQVNYAGNTQQTHIPASLLAQFPDLQKIDWSQGLSGGETYDEDEGDNNCLDVDFHQDETSLASMMQVR